MVSTMTRPSALRAIPRQRRVIVAHPVADLYGSDRTLLETVRALVRGGNAVVVAIPNDGPLVPLLQDAGAEVTFVRAPVVRKAALTPLGLVRWLWELVVALRPSLALVRRERPDVVYVNTVTIPSWLVVAWILRIPTVCHVHEAEDEAPRLVRLALVAPLFTAPARSSSTTRRPLWFVTRSPRGSTERSRSLQRLVPGPEAVTPPRPCLDKSVRLVFVGRLSPRKGGDIAVAATHDLRRRGHHVELTLVGDVFPGYEWYREQLRQDAASGPARDSINFRGFVSDVWPAMDEADIVLVPSRAEPFGNVAVEAMLAARPVVAARVQGLVEAVDDGVTGTLVAPDNPTALAGAVEALVSNWPQARELALAGRKRAVERFNADRFEREVVSVVSVVADRSYRHTNEIDLTDRHIEGQLNETD